MIGTIKKKVIENGYSTDLITKHSANFINQNKNKPFFLFVSHEAPHVPFQGRNLVLDSPQKIQIIMVQ